MHFIDIVTLVLPVFGIIGIGYLARAVNLMGDMATDGLATYAYNIAIPCLLFRLMVDSHWPDVLPWGYWLTYFLGAAIVWISAQLAARFWLKRDFETSIVAGFTAGQANTVLVGIPLIIAVYGDAGGAPLVALVSIHLPIMMTVAAVLMALADSSDQTLLQSLKTVAIRIATHPIIIALALGVAYNFSGLAVSGPPRVMLDAFAGTASTAALFSLGLAVHQYGIEGDLRATIGLTTLKLAIHPAIIYVLGVYFFDLPPIWLGVAILFASSPCGVNAYLVANRYGTGIRISSSAIALSTTIAVVTCGLWLKAVPVP